jgi:ATP-binding protein involved in chromosome partitioning
MSDKKKNMASMSAGSGGQEDQQELRARMSQIKKKFVVLSGKGGVGKSTVAVNLAIALVNEGFRVGLLDVDIHGPSIPKLLGLEGHPVGYRDETLYPVEMTGNLRVMSIGFLLQGKDDAVIWRGPLKMKMIQQFLKDVEWGQLDFLIVDSPPGTGDEPLSVIQLIENADGAIIVTTPQELSIIDVQRSIGFCRKLNLPVSGVIENMSGFICPHCGKSTDIFKSGGGERMAKEVNVPFLGRIPLDPAITETGDEGRPYLMRYTDSETAKAFSRAIKPIMALEEKQPQAGGDESQTISKNTKEG